MRISDWSSDVCSSDLADHDDGERVGLVELLGDALGLLQGHRLDVAVALFQVVDAEVLDLHAHEHAGDIVGAAEAQRKRAGAVGRASCRERVCEYVENSVVVVSIQKKEK